MDALQKLLDDSGRSVYVIDRHTYEVLYANSLAHKGLVGPCAHHEGDFCYAAKDRTEPCADCPLNEMGDAVEGNFIRFDPKHGVWTRITGRKLIWDDHEAFALYVEDITELKQAELDAVKNRSMYEAAVEDARLVVWEYDIAEHRVIMSNNDFTQHDYRKFGIPKVIENAPQSLVPYIADESVEDFLDVYRQVEGGARKASCEVWYKLRPGQEPRYMRITYNTEFDDEGEPVRAYGIGQNITAEKHAQGRYRAAFKQLEQAHPNTVASFHLNLTHNLLDEGKADSQVFPEQSANATADDCFAAFADIIEDEKQKKWARSTFTCEKLLKRFKEGKTEIFFEFPVLTPDGICHWREGQFFLIQNPMSGDVEAMAYAVDIDDRKRGEMIYGVLSQAVFGFIILLDMRSGKILSGGETAPSAKERYENTDYTPVMEAALRKMMPPEMIEEAIREHGIENIRRKLTHQRSFEVTFITKDGSYLHWRFAYADRKREIVLIMREDITAATHKEQERIRELEEERRARMHAASLLQSILDTAPAAMFWKDKDRRFEGANKAFLDFYEFDSLDDILGKNDEDMGWHPDPGPYRDDELRVIRDGISTKRVPGECMSHGKLCHIVASKSPRYEGGKIVGLVGNFEDVTKEFEHAEEVSKLNSELGEALAAARKANEAEQVFLSNVSHDMRTPLNGILGFTDLALQTDDQQKREEYLRKIDLSGDLMLSLVNDVLDMSRIASGKLTMRPQAFESRSLFDAIVDSVKFSAEQRHIAFSTHLDEHYPRFVEADRLRCQQIVLNLLSNAIKYTPDGGSVDFLLEYHVDKLKGCNTLIEISDTGIGMSESFQKRMFELFAQEHQSRMYGTQGTGLGLAIVKNVVDIMGGAIEVESRLGEGTTFRVYLPIKAIEVGKIESLQQNVAPVALPGKKVLLCEDNDLNAEIAQTVLLERGEADVVDRAWDGQEGLKMFESSAIGYYDIILMDIRMPVMNGLDATRAIRALDRADAKTVPIIAMTADAFAEDAKSCVEAGMNVHLAKPFDPAKLIAVAATLCASRPDADIYGKAH